MSLPIQPLSSGASAAASGAPGASALSRLHAATTSATPSGKATSRTRGTHELLDEARVPEGIVDVRLRRAPREDRVAERVELEAEGLVVGRRVVLDDELLARLPRLGDVRRALDLERGR